MKVLVIVGNCRKIDISFFSDEKGARQALMRDLYGNYRDFDLPETDDDAAISRFVADNDLDYNWKIDDVSDPF